MEQHKQMLQAYPTPIDKEVFETVAGQRCRVGGKKVWLETC